MASLLFLPRTARTPTSRAATPRLRAAGTVTCGPHDNRGPLQRGRSLSTEAIHAVQSLKRLTAADRSPAAARGAASASLGRLLRADLLAAMAELQRQGHWALALAALHVARAEPWYRPDPELYATFVSSAPSSDPAAGPAVDALVEAFLDEERGRGRGAVSPEGPWVGEDVYKLTRLARALVAKGRARAAWRVYEAAVRRGGLEVDEYMYRVMARGMKRRRRSQKIRHASLSPWSKAICFSSATLTALDSLLRQGPGLLVADARRRGSVHLLPAVTAALDTPLVDALVWLGAGRSAEVLLVPPPCAVADTAVCGLRHPLMVIGDSLESNGEEKIQDKELA